MMAITKISGPHPGKQHGLVHKKDIHHMREILKQTLQHIKQQGLATRDIIEQRMQELERYIPANYIQQMQELAIAAEVDYQDILLVNTFDDIINTPGCSSFVQKRIADQALIHARNLDFDIHALAGQSIILQNKDTITISFPGYIGALTATNKHGITISSHTSRLHPPQLGIPTGILYAMIRDQATSIDTAAALLRAHQEQITVGNNLMISSVAENTAVVCEIAHEKLMVRYMKDDHLITTNHFITESLATEQTHPYPASNYRYDFIQQQLSGKMIDIQQTQSILCDYRPDHERNTVANCGTVQSVVIIPEQHTLYLASGKSCPVTTNGYQEFKWKR